MGQVYVRASRRARAYVRASKALKTLPGYRVAKAHKSKKYGRLAKLISEAGFNRGSHHTMRLRKSQPLHVKYGSR